MKTVLSRRTDAYRNKQELIRRWDSERELLRSVPGSYTRIRWNNAK